VLRNRRQLVANWLRANCQWLPLAAASIFAVGFVANFGSLIHSIYGIADWSSILNIGQTMSAAPHGTTILITDIYLVGPLAFEWATQHLPGHRTLWELAPWLAGLISSAVLARAVGKASGMWASMVVFLVLACAGYALLKMQFQWDGHAETYETVCILGAFVAFLPLRGGMLGRSVQAWWLWLALAMLLMAGGIASDQLFLYAGVVPFLVAGGVVAWLLQGAARRRALLSLGVVTVGGAILGKIALAVATHEGVQHTVYQLWLAPYNTLLDHFGLIAQSTLTMLNGDFGGDTIALASLVAFAGAAVIVVSAYAAYRHSVAHGRALYARYRGQASVLDAHEMARVALTVYWSMSALVIMIAFVFSSAVYDVNGGQRYAVTLAYAIIVLVSVAAAPRRWARNLSAIGVSVLICSAAIGMFQHDLQNGSASFPQPSSAKALARWARSAHLKYGYASYWDAAPLSWWADSDVAVYPVGACQVGTVHTACAYGQRISSWYTPRPNTRTFFIIDDTFVSQRSGSAVGLLTVPSGFGHPARVVHVAEFTIYVYNYDVAKRFGPPDGS
jgi:hypothetical protein